MKLPCTKAPCKNCPFKKDTLKGWLNNRIEEIVNADSFTCHKTHDPNRLQCSGHMILVKEENIFYRTAKAMGILPNFKGQEQIFDSKEDCIKHHKDLGIT